MTSCFTEFFLLVLRVVVIVGYSIRRVVECDPITILWFTDYFIILRQTTAFTCNNLIRRKALTTEKEGNHGKG